MKKICYGFVLLAIIANITNAHELTPTYPKLKPSVIDGVLMAEMKLWNRRRDVRYYEITVHDSEWNNIPFAAVERLMNVEYNEMRIFGVYVKKETARRITYICTTSKQLKEDVESTGLMTRICSKVK